MSSTLSPNQHNSQGKVCLQFLEEKASHEFQIENRILILDLFTYINCIKLTTGQVDGEM